MIPVVGNEVIQMAIYEDIGRAADEILDRVTDAVQNGNYAHMSEDIAQSIKRNNQIRTNPYASGASRHMTKDQLAEQKAHQTAFSRQAPATSGLSAMSALLTVFIAVNIAIVVVLVLVALFAGFIPKVGSDVRILALVAAGVFGALDLVFVHFLRDTNRRKNTQLLFAKYQKIIGKSEYYQIQELEVKTGQTHEKVVSDIRSMMDAQQLPGASLDPGETTLILSDYARSQYRSLMQNTAARQQADSSLSPEARDIIKKGEEYVAQIHHLNDLIPEEEMSDKLDDLENIMKKIFAEVRKNPAKSTDLRRLMDYYLPTTLKLVQAYADVENKPETENITAMKKEIASSLDMINEACNKIFDEMFEDDAWDISSDINVMKSMMKQDGLVEDDNFSPSDK